MQFGIAQTFSRRLKADCAGEPGVELPVDCEGIYGRRRLWRGGSDSDVEERALFRISPRRDDDAGEPQAEYARRGRRGAERGEVGFAGLAGWAKYPGAELTEDWKKVLFNQFHDLAAGSGIGVIYKDAQKDYDVVRWSTNEIRRGAEHQRPRHR
jgi:hypothetical protein